jgi:hypothetical protein
MHEMKNRIINIAVLAMLLAYTTGCMSYAKWHCERQERSAQRSYNAAVSAKLAERVPLGMWYYELPSPSKIGLPTQLWLTLFGDGSFDRLWQTRDGLFFYTHWEYDHGIWENMGNMSVRLAVSRQTNRTVIIDLSTITNLFVKFEEELREGIQPTNSQVFSEDAPSASSEKP